MKKNIFLLVLVIALFAGCTDKVEHKAETKAVNIRTAYAQITEYNPVLNFAGSVHAWKEANCGSVLPGKVEKFHVNEGDYVQQETLLAELSGELLAQSEIEYNIYKKDYDRVERLYEKGSVSEVDYDHLKAETDAKFEKWQMLKKNTEIRAPFSGIVTEFLVQEGENYMFHPALDVNYSHASGVVRLMQLNPLKIKIEVNEHDLANISIGGVAKITFPALTDQLYEAKITAISATLSHLSRTATVTLKLDNSENFIKPGMFCSVAVQQPSREVVTIPRTALIQLSGTGIYYVYNIVNNQAVRTEVTIDAEMNDLIAVSGLEAGMNIATAGRHKLIDGVTVHIQSEE